MRRSLIALAVVAGALVTTPSLAQTFPPPNSAAQGYQAPTQPMSPIDNIEAARRVESRVDLSKTYAKGVAALQAHDYRTAVHLLARLTDRAPMNPAGWRALGAAYAGQGHWAQSRRAYGRATYLAPNDPVGHAGLGLALKALNNPKAQREAEWLRVRTEACGGTCAEAGVLRTIQSSGPFARSPAA